MLLEWVKNYKKYRSTQKNVSTEHRVAAFLADHTLLGYYHYPTTSTTAIINMHQLHRRYCKDAAEANCIVLSSITTALVQYERQTRLTSSGLHRAAGRRFENRQQTITKKLY